MNIIINRNPHDDNKPLYKYSELELTPGITILVGRNGSGKSTLCHQIEHYCNENKIPVFSYDNYTQGGNTAISNYNFNGDIDSMFQTLFHSEGEQIFYNLGVTIQKIGEFCRKNNSSELVILLDAIDSGLDIEGTVQLKDVLDKIIEDNKLHGVNVYIILTSNSYSLVRGMRCIDVVSGKELRFSSYEHYREYILNSYKKARRS